MISFYCVHMINPDILAEKINTKLPAWIIVDNTLQRQLEFNSSSASLRFANRVAIVAEQQHHHPSLLFTGQKLQIVLYTHDTGGITEKDFVLAKEINTLIKNYNHGMVHEK